MLPIHALLNPAPPSPSELSPKSIPRSGVTDRPGCPFGTPASFQDRSSPFVRTSSLLPHGPDRNRANGPVNYPPFEDVDENNLREIAPFSIGTFGNIANVCEHIPYNSAKKDFFEKTGRESIEVFRYEFCPPRGDTTYTVMWDYNVGLVRMTPFFKCLGYSKTKPSQMLDRNPGLRDISPSVTGGSVTAQGYWMPYCCARAICATFCYPIAGALIPIFGPSFPQDCVKPSSPRYRDMRIDPKIIEYTTLEVIRSRRHELKRVNRPQGAVKSSTEGQRLPSIAELHPGALDHRSPSMARNGWKPINSQPCRPDVQHGAPPRPTSTLAQGRRPLVAERPMMTFKGHGMPLASLNQHNNHMRTLNGNERQPSFDSSLAKRRRTGFEAAHLPRNPRRDENYVYQADVTKQEDVSASSVLNRLQDRNKDSQR